MRHNIRGKRIVLEDASLVDLVRAHMEITQSIMPQLLRQRSSKNIGYDPVFDRTIARRYATALSIEHDIAEEINKRVNQRKWQ
jgi:hypothetical protein